MAPTIYSPGHHSPLTNDLDMLFTVMYRKLRTCGNSHLIRLENQVDEKNFVDNLVLQLAVIKERNQGQTARRFIIHQGLQKFGSFYRNLSDGKKELLHMECAIYIIYKCMPIDTPALKFHLFDIK